MKIIRTKFMRLIGKKYLLFFGFLLTAPKAKITEIDMNHEAIHSAQMKEMFYLFFYLWYLCEWIVRILQNRDAHLAYRNISFEREAYTNEKELEYLRIRKRFAFIKYLWS